MTTKYIRWVASILAAAVIFATSPWVNANTHATVTIEHASGTTTVSKNPKKIVVFDVTALDNMDHLGITTTIGVPEGKKPAYLEHFNDDKYEKIGTLFEPNYEKIAEFRPDLILISSRVRSKYADLSKIAPTIDMTIEYKNTLQNIERNITILGKLFDKEKEAEQEIAKLHENLEMVRKVTKGKGTALVLMTSGGKISALGPQSRFDIFHSGYGIAPATDKLTVQRHGQIVSPEFILETNPDWLLVVDRDAAVEREGQSAAQLLDNELIMRTTAGKKNQIIYLESWSWYRALGGLTGLYTTAKELAEIFAKSE
ncbi:siderophore ABC transporter substrate-binding protein [Bartonella sp. A05]|uniref:siderophore ABC transporter substrate-binding protein n=1 Tax=Bartonella sp. A05 TaxID=2967261 RepID=UPI0022A98519|nr:siderophore ABC transporter substrate-binding protein [Bartonella sp. A05]MCZ2204451.1 siderophore ABC transporter substrate-binding protein [Bartonella sp. A05]